MAHLLDYAITTPVNPRPDACGSGHAVGERPEQLRRIDRRREVDPAWFQRSRVQGYVCYVDRFCGTLDRLPEHLDHLAELGTTYLHLMPLLQPRPGENDGGYAVTDYRAVDPRLGKMD